MDVDGQACRVGLQGAKTGVTRAPLGAVGAMGPPARQAWSPHDRCSQSTRAYHAGVAGEVCCRPGTGGAAEGRVELHRRVVPGPRKPHNAAIVPKKPHTPHPKPQRPRTHTTNPHHKPRTQTFTGGHPLPYTHTPPAPSHKGPGGEACNKTPQGALVHAGALGTHTWSIWGRKPAAALVGVSSSRRYVPLMTRPEPRRTAQGAQQQERWRGEGAGNSRARPALLHPMRSLDTTAPDLGWGTA